MAYRRKMTKKQEARMETGVAIFGSIVCIPIIILGLAVAYSALTAEKGTPVEKILGALGATFFIAGAGVGGLCACAGGLKDSIKTLREEKGHSNQR